MYLRRREQTDRDPIHGFTPQMPTTAKIQRKELRNSVQDAHVGRRAPVTSAVTTASQGLQDWDHHPEPGIIRRH